MRPLRPLNRKVPGFSWNYGSIKWQRPVRGWARAGGRGRASSCKSRELAVSSQWHLWSQSCVAHGEGGGLLVHRTQRAGFAKRESGSGRLEEPALSSAPGIKCRLKRKHSFHHPLPPSLGSLGPFTRLLPQILSGVPANPHPHSWHGHPDKRGFGRLIKTR